MVEIINDLQDTRSLLGISKKHYLQKKTLNLDPENGNTEYQNYRETLYIISLITGLCCQPFNVIIA